MSSSQWLKGFERGFTSVGRNLVNCINSSGVPDLSDTNYKLDCEFTWCAVSADDILRHFTTLWGGSTPGYDDISAYIWSITLTRLCFPSLTLTNLTSGTFTDSFELVNRFPYHKSNFYTNKNNLRPISFLSVKVLNFSKKMLNTSSRKFKTVT